MFLHPCLIPVCMLNGGFVCRPSSLLIVSCLFFLASYLFNIVVYQQPADNSAKMTEKRALLPDNVVPSFYTLVLTPDFSDFHFMGSIAIDVKVKEATSMLDGQTYSCMHFDCNHLSFQSRLCATPINWRLMPPPPLWREMAKVLFRVWLHYLRAVLTLVEIVCSCTAEIAVKEISLQEKEQTVTFSLEEELEADTEWTLKTTFKGKLNDQMVGFYRYVHSKGTHLFLLCVCCSRCLIPHSLSQHRSKYEHNGEEKWMATTQFEPTDARMAFPCWDEPAKKVLC